MKFRFCGGRDAPDWLLSEIGTLSRVTSVRAKVIATQVATLVVEGTFDAAKAARSAAIKDAADPVSDMKGIVAAVHFVLVSAAKHDCSAEVVLLEVQQLGLPAEHAAAICRTYRSAKAALREALEGRLYRSTALREVGWDVVPAVTAGAEATVQLRLGVDAAPHRGAGGGDAAASVDFACSPAQARALRAELVRSLAMIEAVVPEG